MVINGGSRSGAGELASHLGRLDTNETMEVRDLRGVVTNQLHDGLRQMEAIAAGTNCRKSLYHANINPSPGEAPLTPAQEWLAIERLERRLGLSGQPRVVVAHVKNGRPHLHVVWSRIDQATMKAISDSWNYRAHEEVARQLEREFGHAPVQGAHVERNGRPRPTRAPPKAEVQQAARTGRPVDTITAEITRLWQAADSGKAFGAALHEAGYVLAQGDRRGFCLVDSTGGVHSLARRIEGVRTKEVNARLADIDLAALPTVAQARHQVRQRAAAEKSVQASAPVARAARQPDPARRQLPGDVGISARKSSPQRPANLPTATKAPPAAAEGAAKHSPPLHGPKNRPIGGAPERPSMPKQGPPSRAGPAIPPAGSGIARGRPAGSMLAALGKFVGGGRPGGGGFSLRPAVPRLLALFLEPQRLFMPGGGGAASRVTPVKSTPPERLNMRRPDGPSTESIAQLQAAIEKLTAYGISTGESTAEQVLELKNILHGMLEQAGARAILGPYYRPEHRNRSPG